MKTTQLLIILLFLGSCTTYKEFISVSYRADIPNGATQIIVNKPIQEVKAIFTSNGIMVKSLEGGFETESIFIDEGTRAMYKVHEFDGAVRITAFWGITQKVKDQMTLWVGAANANTYDLNTFEQVIYDKDVKRPKRVFDYAVQLVETAVIYYRIK